MNDLMDDQELVFSRSYGAYAPSLIQGRLHMDFEFYSRLTFRGSASISEGDNPEDMRLPDWITYG
jgi:hypothetical protein